MKNEDLHRPQIETSDRYPDILEGLIYRRTESIDVFYGGNVSRKDSGLAWISPITIFENSGDSRNLLGSYHLVYVNFDPTIDINVTPRLLPFIGCESGIKSADCSCGCNDTFNEMLSIDQERPYLILRRSFLGNPVFPHISSYGEFQLDREKQMLDIVLSNLSDAGFNFELDKSFLDYQPVCLSNNLPLLVENEDLTLLGPRMINNDIGTFYGYYASLKNDFWRTYEIISGTPLDSNSNPEMIVRFDSGCDSGQIYDDIACDCRDQFHTALSAIEREGAGLIIHIPSHDGRGYGMAGKMETELYKEGKKGLIHEPKTKLDTVQAAMLLYGDIYDIRTYDGAATILKTLGVSRVRVLTDNSAKFKAIKGAGIDVERVRTGTRKEESQHHIEAKHKTPPYNEASWRES